MKALVLLENGVLQYRDVPLTIRPSPDAALIRVTASGICSSDMDRGFRGKAYHYPLIMGHEFAGIVEEPAEKSVLISTGRAARKGDLVAVFPLIPCYACEACQKGDLAQCESYDYLGSRRDGAFAEYVWVPERNLFPVPKHVEPMHAAMTEPCAVALHAINQLRLSRGCAAAAIGGGAVGNMAAQWLRELGCDPVIVTDVDSRKLEIARSMGLIPVDAKAADAVSEIYTITGGRGTDCVLEACGLPETFLQAIQVAGRFGQVVFMGNIRGEFSIGEKDFSNILRKEIVIHGTWNSRVVPREKNDWTTALEAMDRKIQVSPLISHTPTLDEGPDIFARMIRGGEYFNKVIFRLK